jgi:hypothetical protein
MQDKFKVSLYIRVSTGRQVNEGDSLEEQEKELKKFCEYKNYLIHKVHIERGRSAKNTNRPEYQTQDWTLYVQQCFLRKQTIFITLPAMMEKCIML